MYDGGGLCGGSRRRLWNGENNSWDGAVNRSIDVCGSIDLGWIGKSCLLITPEYGPRVRLDTILTDAPLDAGSPAGERCGECRACVDRCPVRAFSGAEFDPSQPREARFNAHLCREYGRKREEKLGEGLCGLCVFICPYGRPSGPKR